MLSRINYKSCQSSEPIKYNLITKHSIFYAVHKIAYSNLDTNKILDEINEEIWNASRKVNFNI